MTNETEKALTVRLGKDLHAIPVAQIEEVLPALPIEQIPQSPSFVRGVIFVRGHFIPVVDAAERLGIDREEPPEEPPIVCVRVGDRIIGIEFDEALDLIETQGAPSIEAHQTGGAAGLFVKVIEYNEQIIRILNPDNLLTLQEARHVDDSTLADPSRSPST